MFDKENFTKEDIEQLITDKTEEAINLEFKAADALKNKKEMGKDISSFANSAGGIIIYGINEVNHCADSTSFINGNQLTKEWIENVIQTNIHRKVDGIEIYPIRFEGDFNKTVYVVKVPESDNAPHMSKDNRYYKRFNFQATPMEEYEIRQLYNKSKVTKLKISDNLLISIGSVTGPRSKPIKISYTIGIQVENIGQVLEKAYKLELRISTHLFGDMSRNRTNNPILIRDEGYYKVFSIANESPIFQAEINTHISLTVNIDETTSIYLENTPIECKLFFTNGVYRKNFKLSERLTHNGEKLYQG